MQSGMKNSVKNIKSDDLPDGSVILPVKLQPSPMKMDSDTGFKTVIKPAAYIGSFLVDAPTQKERTEEVYKKLESMRSVTHKKSVLLVISLSGIKVCNETGESVRMAHALRRISYATSDPDYCQFSFLAREPKGQANAQYCHTFLTESPTLAEELNDIVGDAFRIAYIRQKQLTRGIATKTPSFNEIIEHQMNTRYQQQQEHQQQLRQQQSQQPLISEVDSSNNCQIDDNVNYNVLSSELPPKLPSHSGSKKKKSHKKEAGGIFEHRRPSDPPQSIQTTSAASTPIAPPPHHRCSMPTNTQSSSSSGGNVTAQSNYDDQFCDYDDEDEDDGDMSRKEIIINQKDVSNCINSQQNSAASDSPLLLAELDSAWAANSSAVSSLASMSSSRHQQHPSNHPSQQQQQHQNNNDNMTPSAFVVPTPQHKKKPNSRNSASNNNNSRCQGLADDSGRHHLQHQIKHHTEFAPLPPQRLDSLPSYDLAERSCGEGESGVGTGATSKSSGTCGPASLGESKTVTMVTSTNISGSGSTNNSFAKSTAGVIGATVGVTTTTSSGTITSDSDSHSSSHGYSGRNRPPKLTKSSNIGATRGTSLSARQNFDCGDMESVNYWPEKWYQPDIPREVALDLLAQGQMGSFVVRDSTSHSGCYALSVRVPKSDVSDNSPSVIHYLILRTSTGFKLKGLEKEWPTMKSLVTHLSVMPEMLPCPLLLVQLKRHSSANNSSNPTFCPIDPPPPIVKLTTQNVTTATATSTSNVIINKGNNNNNNSRNNIGGAGVTQQQQSSSIAAAAAVAVTKTKSGNNLDEIVVGADDEEDLDYQRLSDFSSIMADLFVS